MRSWPRRVVVGGGSIVGAALLAAGVALVVLDRIDPVTAALLGGLALAAVEGAVELGDRLVVRPAVPGTWTGRAMAVGTAVLAGIGVAAVVGPGGHPSSASVLVGIAGIVAFLGLIGVQVSRSSVPTARSEPPPS